MIINVNTKIGALIRHNPETLEAIVSISPKFVKLRNPLLRKVIAGRASIAMASKIGGCGVDNFFNVLKPLGFEIDNLGLGEKAGVEPVPGFLKDITPDKIIELDVRPVIEAGKDPLNIILQKVKSLDRGQVLKIVNSFEPTPLMHLLGRQGFESYSEIVTDELVQTYFYKKTNTMLNPADNVSRNSESWDEVLQRFNGEPETIDVRHLEMPLPMLTIMEALETLPAEKVLFVYHKRIPVFLLSELKEQKFSYHIREISDEEVNLLIYKD
ncbi:DUF2249 domain-containing protein [Chitinophaga oryziterrae]|uniref:DUF2249 domain-containing protein n=1 Tax=Chitinophaga oryziterrae TaxID=1031224 RepID=A0A6N8JCW9_9BACT|nr:DUF2249 domain-containing protein [Chitinophaga oryziterrae]MVT42196.1 DUF2249 domain-containing protein [Chitinophaga oryziterrae]